MQVNYENYSEYLLTSPYNYTNTHMADPISDLSHVHISTNIFK